MSLRAGIATDDDDKKNLHEAIADGAKDAPPPTASSEDSTRSEGGPKVSDRAVAFYYAWYGNPEFDGRWEHWNHPIIRHWNDKSNRPVESHRPPEDIASLTYPVLGPYSSRDPSVLRKHMAWLRTAGIGIACLSFWAETDQEGVSDTFSAAQLVLDAAAAEGIKVSLHLEPYKGRNPRRVRSDLEEIVKRFGDHAAMMRPPLYFVYDSYLSGAQEWAQILKPGGSLTVRNTPLDGHFVALVVERRHMGDAVSAGFDGLYTYFASTRFTWGSTVSNWKSIAGFAKQHGMSFWPSCGPGYDDLTVRPWNGVNTKSRENGEYYRRMFRAALDALKGTSTGGVSITSFNEHHEGTTIEPAKEFKTKAVAPGGAKATYPDFGEAGPNKYLDITRELLAGGGFVPE